MYEAEIEHKSRTVQTQMAAMKHGTVCACSPSSCDLTVLLGGAAA
jgi:hypothetical protein